MSKLLNQRHIHWKILVALTEQLKIPDRKYKDAVEKYKNVGAWLEKSNDPIFRGALIYPQGSVRLGTTVKPYGNDEYDIDLVVHLPHVTENASSERIKNTVGARLRENGIYAQKLLELKRGWRINYAGDFYLDITPAIPDNNCNSLCPINKQYAEHVPDSKLYTWKASNPRGYAEWFIKIDEKMPVFINESHRMIALDVKNVEEIPNQDEFKGVLKRTVQLLKRHRDIFFNETYSAYKDWQPISILITTLAAHAYNNLIQEQRVFTPIDLIKSIIINMRKYIVDVNGIAYVANPTNQKENFAEKWKESIVYQHVFEMWIDAVYSDIEKILSSEGIDNVVKVINGSFGSQYGNAVLESMNSEVKQNRDASLLAPGIFSANSTAPVKKNTFFGS